jgi:hypothetical protein
VRARDLEQRLKSRNTHHPEAATADDDVFVGSAGIQAAQIVSPLSSQVSYEDFPHGCARGGPAIPRPSSPQGALISECTKKEKKGQSRCDGHPLTPNAAGGGRL